MNDVDGAMGDNDGPINDNDGALGDNNGALRNNAGAVNDDYSSSSEDDSSSSDDDSSDSTDGDRAKRKLKQPRLEFDQGLSVEEVISKHSGQVGEWKISAAPHVLQWMNDVCAAYNKLIITAATRNNARTHSVSVDCGNQEEYKWVSMMIELFVYRLGPKNKYDLHVYNSLDSFQCPGEVAMLISVWKSIQEFEPDVADEERMSIVLKTVVDSFESKFFNAEVDAMMEATLEGSWKYLHRKEGGKITRFHRGATLTNSFLFAVPEELTEPGQLHSYRRSSTLGTSLRDLTKIETLDLVLQKIGNIMKNNFGEFIESARKNKNWLSDFNFAIKDAIPRVEKGPHGEIIGYEFVRGGCLILVDKEGGNSSFMKIIYDKIQVFDDGIDVAIRPILPSEGARILATRKEGREDFEILEPQTVTPQNVIKLEDDENNKADPPMRSVIKNDVKIPNANTVENKREMGNNPVEKLVQQTTDGRNQSYINYNLFHNVDGTTLPPREGEASSGTEDKIQTDKNQTVENEDEKNDVSDGGELSAKQAKSDMTTSSGLHKSLDGNQVYNGTKIKNRTLLDKKVEHEYRLNQIINYWNRCIEGELEKGEFRISAAPHVLISMGSVCMAYNHYCICSATKSHSEKPYVFIDCSTEFKTWMIQMIETFLHRLNVKHKYDLHIYNSRDKFKCVAPIAILVSIWKSLEAFDEPDIGEESSLNQIINYVLQKHDYKDVIQLSTVLYATVMGSEYKIHLGKDGYGDQQMEIFARANILKDCYFVAVTTNCTTPSSFVQSPILQKSYRIIKNLAEEKNKDEALRKMEDNMMSHSKAFIKSQSDRKCKIPEFQRKFEKMIPHIRKSSKDMIFGCELVRGGGLILLSKTGWNEDFLESVAEQYGDRNETNTVWFDRMLPSCGAMLVARREGKQFRIERVAKLTYEVARQRPQIRREVFDWKSKEQYREMNNENAQKVNPNEIIVLNDDDDEKNDSPVKSVSTNEAGSLQVDTVGDRKKKQTKVEELVQQTTLGTNQPSADHTSIHNFDGSTLLHREGEGGIMMETETSMAQTVENERNENSDGGEPIAKRARNDMSTSSGLNR